jgi:hypothetical protein
MVSAKEPAGQLLHWAEPVSAWNAPVGHRLQLVLPVTALKAPTGQAVQGSLPVALNWPTGHWAASAPKLRRNRLKPRAMNRCRVVMLLPV